MYPVRQLTITETWRFFVPIFLHVGIVHFLLNMVAQIFAGAQVEKEMGT
jgi:membrane associated rhomboid family serine protease